MSKFTLNQLTSAIIVGITFSSYAVYAADNTAKNSKDNKADVETISVVGKSVNAGALGALKIQNMPFSASAIGELELTETGAQNIEDIFKSDASVNTSVNGTSSIISEISVRGLRLDQDNGYKIDGLPFPNRASLPIEHFSQVELYKGLAGFQYGFVAPGGIVNYVSKRPTDDNSTQLKTSFTSDSTFSLMADRSQNLTDEVDARVVAVKEKGDTYVDDGEIDRTSMSINLDANITNSITIFSDYLYQDKTTEGVIFSIIPVGPDSIKTNPNSIKGTTQLGPTDSFYTNKMHIGTLGINADLSDSWKTKLVHRMVDSEDAFRESALILFPGGEGDYFSSELSGRQKRKYSDTEFLLLGELETGAIKHNISFGGNNQTQALKEPEFIGVRYAPTNIYAPAEQTSTGQTLPDLPSWDLTDIKTKSVFASDNITMGNFSLLLGVRYISFEQIDRGYENSEIISTYKTSDTTPTFALSYVPNDETTIYASYVEAFQKGGKAGQDRENAGESFGALMSKQAELGLKLNKESYSLTAAMFRMEIGSEYVDENNYFVQDGKSQFDGFELAGKLHISDDLTVFAQGMIMDTEYTSADAIIIGNDVKGVPSERYSTGIVYNPIDDLKLRVSANYVGGAQLNAANAYKTDGYTTVDIFASYNIDDSSSLNFGIKNMFNEEYYTVKSSLNTDALTVGAPRTLTASYTIYFE